MKNTSKAQEAKAQAIEDIRQDFIDNVKDKSPQYCSDFAKAFIHLCRSPRKQFILPA